MGPQFVCAHCGHDVDVSKRHYSRATIPKLVFCNKRCRALYDGEHGHFKAMSQAGRRGRIAFLQAAKPRRMPSSITNKKISATLKRRYQQESYRSCVAQ